IMSAIVTKIVEKYNPSPKMSVSDLNGFKFSSDQKNRSTFKEPLPCNRDINIAISNKSSKGMEKETIGDMAYRLLQDKLSIRYIRAEVYTLALLALNANAGSSCLSRLWRELRNIGASSQIIEATKFSDITEDANKIQSVNQKKAEAKCINYLDEFTLESVKERLDAYDIKTLPD
ncbi:7170_t:CDS:2, partial [Dentiscutata erythropus]